MTWEYEKGIRNIICSLFFLKIDIWFLSHVLESLDHGPCPFHTKLLYSDILWRKYYNMLHETSKSFNILEILTSALGSDTLLFVWSVAITG
jgi:hypothetical protein